MKAIAIITARGGSKRIPKKNIREFCGKPILAYSIEAALQAGVFDTVMVSTDSEEIARIALEYGAEVPFYRSEKTSSDYATTNDVLLEVLAEYEKRGQTFDLTCCIYPTAPFVTGRKLRDALERLCASDADTILGVVPFSFPPQRAMVTEQGRLVFEYPQYLDTRSQDLVPHYHDAGQFSIMKTGPYLVNKKVLLGKILPMVLDEMEVQDIDNETDWEIAQIKYRMMREREEHAS